MPCFDHQGQVRVGLTCGGAFSLLGWSFLGFLFVLDTVVAPIDVEKALVWCQQKTGKDLAPTQKEAVKQALSSRILIITGGPGGGKTTLVNAILLVLRPQSGC